MNKKFAATELIETLYQIDKSKLIELKDKFNFLEETTKGFGDQMITESLAQNLVKNLPLEIYKDLISLNWFSEVKHKKENNPIAIALLYKKFDFIEVVLNQLDKKLIENKKNDIKFNNEDRIYSSLVLQKIIDFPIKESMTEFGYTQKDVNKSFFGIWNHAVNLMYEYEQYIYINGEKKEDVNISTLMKLNKIQDIRIDQMLLLREACRHKSMYSFFVQVMSELNDKEKEEIKSYPSKSLLMNALFCNNKKVADFLVKENFYNTRALVDIVVETNTRVSKTGLSEKDKKEYQNAFEQARNLLSEKELQKIPAYNLIGVINLYKDNKEEMDRFVKDFPQVLSESLLQNEKLSIVDFISIERFKNHFEEKYDVKFLKLKDTIEYYNINQVRDILASYQESSKDNERELIGAIMQSSVGLLTKFKMDVFEQLKSTNVPSEYNQILEKELLEISLKKSNINEKAKIKI